jgi:hypothetical protein
MFYNKAAGRNHSHTVLSGNREVRKIWSIPDDRIASFIMAASQHVVSQYSNGRSAGSLVEQKSTTFPLFFDIDAEMRTTNIECLLPVLARFRDTVAAVYEIPDVTMLTSKASKHIAINKEVLPTYKVGIHIIFPGVFVKGATAISIRKQIIRSLEEFNCPFANGWDSAIDESVLKGSGLRMLWMDKTDTPAPERVYIPWFEMTNAGVKHQEYTSRMVNDIPFLGVAKTAALLKQWSIHTPYAKETPVRLPEDDAKSIATLSLPVYNIDIDPEVLTILERRINYCFRGSLLNAIPEQYHGEILSGNVRISGIMPREIDGKVVSYLIKPESNEHVKWCVNKQGKHSKNHAYFVMTENGIRQHCLSEHDHRGVKCSCFKGPYWTLPNERIKKYFFV